MSPVKTEQKINRERGERKKERGEQKERRERERQ